MEDTPPTPTADSPVDAANTPFDRDTVEKAWVALLFPASGLLIVLLGLALK